MEWPSVHSTLLDRGVAGHEGGHVLTWEPCSWLCFTGETRAEAFLVGAVGGAVLSLPFAVVVGALVKEDRWTAVRPGGPPSALTERVRVDVRPSRSGLSLGASIALGGGA